MKSVMFLGLCGIGYVGFIGWIIFKLRDISRHPKKYNVIHGWERYHESYWYERSPERYGKNYYAGLYVGIPMLFLTVLLYARLGSLLQKHWLIPRDAQPLASSGLGIGAIASIFFSVGLSQFLAFYGKSPMLVAARLSFAGRDEHQPTAWKNMFTWLLVLSLVCLPIMAMGVHSCNYADEEKIVTHSLFSVTAREIPYDTIEAGATTYVCDGGFTEFSLTYRITLEDGTQLQVDGETGMAYIDARLREKGIPVTYGEIDGVTYGLLKQKCNDSDVSLIEDFLKIVE